MRTVRPAHACMPAVHVVVKVGKLQSCHMISYIVSCQQPIERLHPIFRPAPDTQRQVFGRFWTLPSDCHLPDTNSYLQAQWTQWTHWQISEFFPKKILRFFSP